MQGRSLRLQDLDDVLRRCVQNANPSPICCSWRLQMKDPRGVCPEEDGKDCRGGTIFKQASERSPPGENTTKFQTQQDLSAISNIACCSYAGR
mmetsp:Transcript_59051/g.120998  ORF Transcript_59051/g.120998 Transcript_59051/m.120998 type:complete len:93 (-) Transcript_59051:53-331(-)